MQRQVDAVHDLVGRHPGETIVAVGRDLRPRSNRGHLSPQHVEQLRNLVDAGRSQKLPELEHPRIFLCRRSRLHPVHPDPCDHVPVYAQTQGFFQVLEGNALFAGTLCNQRPPLRFAAGNHVQHLQRPFQV